MQGHYDDLEALVRRFIFHYLVNLQRPLEEQINKEIKNTIDRIFRQFEQTNRRDILLGEDRTILADLSGAMKSGDQSAIQDKMLDLVRLLGVKNQRVSALPVQPRKKYGAVTFGTATAFTAVFLFAVALGNWLR